MFCIRHIQDPAIYRTLLLSSIKTYSGTFISYLDTLNHVVAYLEPCVTLAYSEFWHIQNPIYIQNSVKAYFGIFRTLFNVRMLRTLPYLELCHIQDFGIFRTKDTFTTMSNIKDGGHQLKGNYSSTKSHLSCLARSQNASVLRSAKQLAQ